MSFLLHIDVDFSTEEDARKWADSLGIKVEVVEKDGIFSVNYSTDYGRSLVKQVEDAIKALPASAMGEVSWSDDDNDNGLETIVVVSEGKAEYQEWELRPVRIK